MMKIDVLIENQTFEIRTILYRRKWSAICYILGDMYFDWRTTDDGLSYIRLY